MKAYIAGPMTGEDAWGFPVFDRAASFLRTVLEWDAVSPADLDRAAGFDGVGDPPAGFDRESCLRRDFRAVTDCDGIVLLPGWQRSNGARKELRVAMDCGLRLFVLREAPEWHAADLRPLTYDDAATMLDPHVSDEVRVVSSTGGAKGQKRCQLGAVDPAALRALGEVAGYGAEKYDRANYLRGFAWHLSTDALYRHLLAFETGEDYDPESGLPHTAHVAWHGLSLTSFLLRGIGTDDRPLLRKPEK